MRLRKVKNAPLVINNNPDKVLVDASLYKGKWHELFKNDNPIDVEIGMGKGKFLYTHATNNPNINYIGIEKEASVIVRAVEKVIENPLSNLILLNCDATNILEMFDENEVDKIFLNFSDPWPKSRHSKRRLTYPSFLMNYKRILKPSGDIEIKTDFARALYAKSFFVNNPMLDVEYYDTDQHTYFEFVK